MWLAKNMKRQTPTADADQGISTIVSDQMGVVTRGEVRQLPIYGPGGYVWLPESGASVLVIKGGPGGRSSASAAESRLRPPKGCCRERSISTAPAAACTCGRMGPLNCQGGYPSRGRWW